MIIQPLHDFFEKGHQKREEHAAVAPFFGAANVAVRKEVFNSIGLFDEKCLTGEDLDLSIRTSKGNWHLYFEPEAIVFHKNHTTLKGLISQWFNYGFYHAYVFKKHNNQTIEIYISRTREKKRFKCIYYSEKFPFHALIFITSFLLFHILALGTLMLLAFGLYLFALASGVLALFVFLYYVKEDLKQKGFLEKVKFIGIRYLLNMALSLGGFLGGLKVRILYITGLLEN